MNLIEQARLYPRDFASLNVDPSFRVDEGYSEDTRSPDDHDFSIKLEPGTTETTIPVPMMVGVPEGIMALSEAERSGIDSQSPYASMFKSLFNKAFRLCIQCVTHFTNIIDISYH